MRNQAALKQQGDVIWHTANLRRGPDKTPFNRHFCEHKPPPPLAAIEQDRADLGRDIVALLKGVTA